MKKNGIKNAANHILKFLFVTFLNIKNKKIIAGKKNKKANKNQSSQTKGLKKIKNNASIISKGTIE